MERDIYAGRQSVIFAVPTPSAELPPGVTSVGEAARVDAYSPGQYDPTLA
jgi:hypothetical protein